MEKTVPIRVAIFGRLGRKIDSSGDQTNLHIVFLHDEAVNDQDRNVTQRITRTETNGIRAEYEWRTLTRMIRSETNENWLTNFYTVRKNTKPKIIFLREISKRKMKYEKTTTSPEIPDDLPIPSFS